MTDLQQGGNAAAPDQDLTVRFDWSEPSSGAVDADISAYLLTASGKVRSDADMVFYNQPEGANGSVQFAGEAGTRGSFNVNLRRLPSDIDRIVFCVTIADSQSKQHTLALLSNAMIEVSGGSDTAALTFRPELKGASEAAMMFGELYKRNEQWKFRAVGQGFNGGLAPLARSFGIDVEKEDSTPTPTPTPPAASKVNLSKISLEKPRQAISLEKKGSGFGEITINLNWSRGKKGFFGGSAVDLDLGCLYELENGQKGAVQALGKAFGSFTEAPFIALSGDDRTGDESQGETMRINGAQWKQIRRIMVFAHIYKGVPNWNQTDGVITVLMPDQPPIEVRMTEGGDRMRMCGVVLIENVDGQLKATRIVEYHGGHRDLDKSQNWGLRWVAGSKD